FANAAFQLRAVQSTEFAKKSQRLLAGEEFVEVRIFRQKAHRFPALDQRTIAPKNSCSSARRRNETENNFQGGALARAIGTKQSVDFARFDAQIQIAHRDDRLSMKGDWKNFREPLNRDGRSRFLGTPVRLGHTAWQVSHDEY